MVGNYKDGNLHGFCKISFKDGSTFEGMFANGELNGNGVQKWKDGRSLEGQWLNGSLDGEINQIDVMGLKQQFLYRNGIRKERI